MASNDVIMMEIQRALGRVENAVSGMRKDMTNGMKDIRDEFTAHKHEDHRNFAALRDDMKEQNTKREAHLDDQDDKLAAIALVNTRLETQDENTRTIGKYILAVIGSFTLLIGSAVVAAITGHIKIE